MSERNAMPQRALAAPPPRTPRHGGCRGWLFSLLLLSMVVVFGVQAAAHPEPVLPHSVVVEDPAQANPPAPAPHCEHGHGQEYGAEILLRGERLDAEGTSPLRPDPAAAPPAVVTTLGLPNAAPTLADPPLYLLTQRLRP